MCWCVFSLCLLMLVFLFGQNCVHLSCLTSLFDWLFISIFGFTLLLLWWWLGKWFINKLINIDLICAANRFHNLTINFWQSLFLESNVLIGLRLVGFEEKISFGAYYYTVSIVLKLNCCLLFLNLWTLNCLLCFTVRFSYDFSDLALEKTLTFSLIHFLLILEVILCAEILYDWERQKQNLLEGLEDW